MWMPIRDGQDFLFAAFVAALAVGVIGWTLYGDAVREAICQLSK